MNVWIRPFEDQGPYCRAAYGQKNMITTIKSPQKDIRQKAIRDFNAEKNSFQSLIDHCPALSQSDDHTDEWYFESTGSFAGIRRIQKRTFNSD